MKRRNPTQSQIDAALQMYAVASPASVARSWLIHWPTIPPTVRRYQEAVCLARVLSEHHAAVAAEPIPPHEEATPHVSVP